MAWTIATKADVYSLYKKDIEELEDEWSTYAESLLLEYLGKNTVDELINQTSFVDYLSGTDGEILLTTHPVNEDGLTSIVRTRGGEVADESIDLNYITVVSNELIFDSNYGKFYNGYRNYKVSYTGTIPKKEIYTFAVSLMIIAILNYESRKGSDADMEWASIAPEYGLRTPNQSIGLVDHLNSILYSLLGKRTRVRIR